MELQLSFFTVTLVLAGAFAQIQNDIDVDDIKKQIGNEMPGIDMSGIDDSKIPHGDELDIIFRNKCDSKSGNGTYDNVKGAKDIFTECISSFVNATELKEEVDEAKKTGSMDEVFGKYCDKFPSLSNCTKDFISALEPCLEENESNSLNISIGLTQKLKDFACHKNGDRIAMFVAEGGVECISSQKEALQQCINNTLGSRIPADATPNSLPVLMFDAQDCSDFANFRKCISEALGHCKETTPGNLVDAFFKYLKKILPCSIEAAESKSEVKNSDAFATTPIAGLTIVLSALLVKFF